MLRLPSSAAPLLIVLGAALLACKKSSSEAPVTVSTDVAAAAPVASGPCPAGHSVDPGPGEFRPAVTAFREKQYTVAQKLLDTLAQKYPNSSQVRVWRGDASLYEKSTLAAADASLPFYQDALRLSDAGCKLEDVEHYYLLLGLANVYLRKKDGASAKPHMVESTKAWPDSAQSFYVLARAQCSVGEIEPCADSFEQALKVAKALRRPKFLRTPYTLDDWVRMSKTQSEFGKLRSNPRYGKIVAAALKDD